MSLPTFTIHTDESRMGAIGASFAGDLTRRISQSQALDDAAMPESPAGDESQAAALAEKQDLLQEMESALSGTVEYMRDKHGEKAASAMIGIVYKRLGNGEVNEQTLGEAFLDVTRFIDKNFGTGAGDAFMSHLNGDLNTSMNAFFDNGLNEKFMVAPASSGGGGGVDAAGMLEEVMQQYADAIKEMLEEARSRPEEGMYAQTAQKDSLVGVMQDIVV